MASGQSHCPSSSPFPFVLEAPPGLGWGELVHIPHLVVGLVAHGEEELVAEADLLLGRDSEGRGSEVEKRLPPPHSGALSQPGPHLLGVGEEQDLGDG